jgi:hypothetical protein
MTTLAFAEPFIAAGAAAAFIRCSLLFFKGPHGLVVPPRLGPFLLQEKVRPPRLWAEWNYEWKLANSNYRKTYINLKQIVHSLNLRSPLFRIDWCGNYSLSPRRTFHSSRRSGSILVLFCYRKRTKPPRLWAEWNYMCLVTPSTRKISYFECIFLQKIFLSAVHVSSWTKWRNLAATKAKFC